LPGSSGAPLRWSINLVKKDGKIRFNVDLGAARRAHLQVSSQLLSLAANVQTSL